MTRLTPTALVLSAALAAAATSTPVVAQGSATAPSNGLASADCFRVRDMENHTVGGPTTLYVNVRPHKVYRFEMSGSCLAGRTGSDPLVIKQTTASDIICRPLDMDISIRSGTGPGSFPTPCLISSISKLTPAEVAARSHSKHP